MFRFLLVLLIVGGCSSTPDERTPAPIAVSVALNKVGVAPADRLNVSIIAFDPGLDSSTGKITQFGRHLRDAEAGYMPVVLKMTLDTSGFWGAVRVLPEVDPMAEVLVVSKIVESDAVKLRIHVRVSDGRGHVWLDRQYFDTATDHGYLPGQLGAEDPFQDLYDEIANDMSRVRISLTSPEVSDILDVSTLRYAVALSPEVFEQYLETAEDGSVVLSGLPARNDPMYMRVRKIRESEYRFVDTMDEQFDTFYTKMQAAYPYWRQYSFELMVYNEELEQSPGVKRARRNKWKALEEVYRTYKEYKLNEDELRELAVSLDSEIKPTVAEYEGRVIELSGSLKTQYMKWRDILRKIYAAERE